MENIIKKAPMDIDATIDPPRIHRIPLTEEKDLDGVPHSFSKRSRRLFARKG